jgi:hypothetical protein
MVSLKLRQNVRLHGKISPVSKNLTPVFTHPVVVMSRSFFYFNIRYLMRDFEPNV